MKKLLLQFPLAFCGVMLGIASLGNLLQALIKNQLNQPSTADEVHLLFGLITLTLLIIVILKVIFCRAQVDKMLQNPETLGVFTTFPMTLTIFAGYAEPYSYPAAYGIYWFGCIMHIFLMIVFTWRYVIKNFNLKMVLPPWYIIYVGFGVCGFNTENFAPRWFGQLSFWIGLVGFTVIFFLLIARSMQYRLMPMQEPMFCINAAIGIVLTSYNRNFTDPSIAVVLAFEIVSLLIWLWLLWELPKWTKLPFYPSDAAFSFPFVVSAVASMETMKALKAAKMAMGWIMPVIWLQSLVAIIMVGFAIYKFAKHQFLPARN